MASCRRTGNQTNTGRPRGEHFSPEESPRQFIDLIEDFREAGLTHFIFGDWGYNPPMTVCMFGKKVIPHFKKK